MEARKPFKDTKLGQFLLQKVPHIAQAVANVLPDTGVLGVVKNLVEGLAPEQVTPEDKAEIMRLIAEQEARELEFEKVAAEDRANARSREVEVLKTGNADWLTRNLASVLALIFVVLGFMFFFMVMLVPDLRHDGNRDIVMLLVGMIGNLMFGVAGYYFGSSLSSKRKEEQIYSMNQRQGPS